MTSNNGGNSEWLERQQKASRKTKWWIIGGVVVVVVIIIAVAVGVSVSKNKHNNTLASSGGGGGGAASGPPDSQGYSTIAGTAGVVKANPKDPSQFEKDPRLIRSFYGFAYTPLNVQMPNCGAVQANVTEDIQLLSQLTNRIRLYGADCNQTALVLEAVQQTKVDMQVFLAIYVDGTNATYTRQKADILAALTAYGVANVAGIAVGNEYMLNSLSAANSDDPTSSTGLTAAAYLGTLITDFRKSLAALKLPKTIPVGTADAGAYFNVQLLDEVDYAMSNVHPWFGNVSINDAAGWTWEFFEENNIAMSNKTTTNPTWYIAETGWPTKSSDAASANDGPSLASVPNLQVFLDTFVCQSNTNGTKYFFFEYFDEPWKDVLYGGVEGWWGLFDSNKNLKNVTIPNCPVPPTSSS